MPGMQGFVKRFSDEEKRILSPFFTNVDKPVFAFKNMPQETAAALIARYSRAQEDMRTMFLKEFVSDGKGNYHEGLMDHIDNLEKGSQFRVGGPRSSKFFHQVFSQYGDDSVIDSASAHVALEGIDQVTAKDVEDGRLAGYIEKSTRYVPFDVKYGLDSEGFVTGPTTTNGHYLYKEYPEVQASNVGSQYTQTMDLLFETLTKLTSGVSKQLVEEMPLDDMEFTISTLSGPKKVKFDGIRSLEGIDIEKEERIARSAYDRSIKAKTFDLVRGVLPASTITNVGWHASFRTFDHSLVKMRSLDYSPSVETGEMVYDELVQISEPLIKRVKEPYGLQETEFLKSQRRTLSKIAQDAKVHLQKIDGVNEPGIKLYDAEEDEDASIKVAAATLFPYTNVSLMELSEFLSESRDRKAVIEAASQGRTNRRLKPPRSFELSNHVVEYIGNFGIYRDLQRNRMMTQVRQDLTTDLGYDMPKIIVDSGMEGVFKNAMEASGSLHHSLKKEAPAYSQSATTFAHRMRWYAGSDARQAFWYHELRTGQQGHPDYRVLVQQSYEELNGVNPSIFNEKTMPHVDMKHYGLERLAAAHKTETKLEKMK